MPRVVPNPTQLLDEIGHAGGGPQAGVVSKTFGTTLEPLLNTVEVAGLQQRFSPCPPGLLQGPPSTVGELPGPTIDGLAMHTDLPRHLRFAQALSQQRRSTQAPFFQSIEVSFNTGWVSHAGILSPMRGNVTILCESQ